MRVVLKRNSYCEKFWLKVLSLVAKNVWKHKIEDHLVRIQCFANSLASLFAFVSHVPQSQNVAIATTCKMKIAHKISNPNMMFILDFEVFL